MARYVAPGKDSTEYRAMHFARLVALPLLLVGIIGAGAGALLERMLLVVVGLGFAAIGGYIFTHTTGSYSLARGQVKASAAAPELHGRGI